MPTYKVDIQYKKADEDGKVTTEKAYGYEDGESQADLEKDLIERYKATVDEKYHDSIKVKVGEDVTPTEVEGS